MNFAKAFKLLAVVTLSNQALASQSSIESRLIMVQVDLPGFGSRSVAEYRQEISRLDEAVKIAAARYSEKIGVLKMSCQFVVSDFAVSLATNDVAVLGKLSCLVLKDDFSKIDGSDFAGVFSIQAGRSVLTLDHEPFGSATIGN